MHSNTTSVIIDLDELDKIIIIAGAALFLVCVVVCLICALNPACCLHTYCAVQYNEPVKQPLQPVYGSVYDPGLHPEKKGQGIQSHRGPVWHPMPPLHESELSDWSDINAPDIIEMKQEASNRQRKWSRTSDYSSSASTITTSVQSESRLAYSLTFDSVQGKLQIRVIQLGNFRVTEPDGVMAPYVKICLYRIPKHVFSFKTKSPKELNRSNLESEVQTKILRRTDNPVFNETFYVLIARPEISTYTIKFLVCDFDKFSRHVVIGEVLSDLSKVDFSSGEEVLFNELLMEAQEEDLGELHVALMYLPTAEKLSVTVINARGLKVLDGPKRSTVTEVYTKITLMYNGRALKKTKTTAKANELTPVFNETFVFDVPIYQLDKVYFILTVIEAEKDREESRHPIGRLYIGVSFDASAKAQWLEMVQNARKQVACWHNLQN